MVILLSVLVFFVIVVLEVRQARTPSTSPTEVVRHGSPPR